MLNFGRVAFIFWGPSKVHPDEMPQFIDYIDDGSGWDKEFATA